MNHTKHILGLIAAACVASAGAATVHVEVQGVVDYSVIGGVLAPVPDGAPVVMGFDVDSNVFLNSASFPTRGYTIDLTTFDLNVGGVHLALDNPQPGNAPVYFVLRDNDPLVDGFFMSRGVDIDSSMDMHIPGLAPVHDFDFARSFTVGTALTSLDILDAVGTYGTENIGSYLWTIGRFGGVGAEFAYQSITISAVPEPATAALFAIGVTGVLLRRRLQRD